MESDRTVLETNRRGVSGFDKVRPTVLTARKAEDKRNGGDACILEHEPRCGDPRRFLTVVPDPGLDREIVGSSGEKLHMRVGVAVERECEVKKAEGCAQRPEGRHHEK